MVFRGKKKEKRRKRKFGLYTCHERIDLVHLQWFLGIMGVRMFLLQGVNTDRGLDSFLFRVFGIFSFFD